MWNIFRPLGASRRMGMKLAALAAVALILGCTEAPAAPPSPTATPSPTPSPRWSPTAEAQAAIIERRISAADAIQGVTYWNGRIAVEERYVRALADVCQEVSDDQPFIDLDLWPAEYRGLVKLDISCAVLGVVLKESRGSSQSVWRDLDNSMGAEWRATLSRLPTLSHAQLRDRVEDRR